MNEFHRQTLYHEALELLDNAQDLLLHARNRHEKEARQHREAGTCQCSKYEFCIDAPNCARSTGTATNEGQP